MSQQQSFVGRDLYFEVVTSDGSSSIRYARVWDASLFIAELREAGAKARNQEDRFTVATATADDYKRANGARRH